MVDGVCFEQVAVETGVKGHMSMAGGARGLLHLSSLVAFRQPALR